MVEELVANPMLGFFEETNLFTTLMSLVAHGFGRVKFGIFFVVFTGRHS